MIFESHHCVLIMGTRGCGKSTLAKNIQVMWPRRVVIDTLNEYEADEFTKIVYSFDEFSQELLYFNDVNKSEFTLVYQFDAENESSVEEFNQVCRVCYYFGNIQIVLEEVQEHSSVHFLPHWLRQCLLKGRHQNISVLSTTQRPGELNKTLLSQSQHIFCGQIIEGNDLRYVASFLRQNAQRLIELPKGQFLYFSSQGVTEINNLL